MIKSIKEFNPEITIDTLKKAIGLLDIPIYISPVNFNRLKESIRLIDNNIKLLSNIGTNIEKVRINAEDINKIKKAIILDMLNLSEIAFEAVDLDIEDQEENKGL